MNHLYDTIWIEFRKVIRSPLPLFITAGSLFMPLGIAFLIFISRNPEISQKLGLVGAKANLTAYAGTNWGAYLGLFCMVIAAGGFFLFCFIISWIFGREFTDGTLKDMLAVPVQRSSILLAKFIVAAAWSGVLSIFILVLGLATGTALNLPQGSVQVMLQGGGMMAVTAGLTILLAMPFAFFASAGRGYLLPIGVAIIALMMANVATVAGWGDYFPWAIAGLYAQGPDAIAPISYGIVLLTGLAGIAGTMLWWKFADQNR